MRRTVRPADGARVFDPDHMDFLPPEGREAEIGPFWLAHVTQGNVTLLDPAAEAAEPAQAGPAAQTPVALAQPEPSAEAPAEPAPAH